MVDYSDEALLIEFMTESIRDQTRVPSQFTSSPLVTFLYPI
jgi:hypothetical protein